MRAASARHETRLTFQILQEQIAWAISDRAIIIA